MKQPDLQTGNPNIRLMQPNVERDSQFGVEWLNSEVGRTTLLLMGNSLAQIEQILPTNLKTEEARVKDFIDGTDQLNWMIEFNNKVIGSIWVDLKDKIIELADKPEAPVAVKAPAIHIMVGDPDVRGKGIGTSATQAVIEYLRNKGETAIYSRHLASNVVAKNLLAEFGFKPDGEPYTDKDGLSWQNVILIL